MSALRKRALAAMERLGVPPGTRVVVGVSAGADSVALARLLHPAYPLVVAHLEHGMRGEASMKDAAFAEALAAELGVACVVEHVDPEVWRGRGDRQAHARALRYAFLARAARAHDAAFVAVAHHAGDVAETFVLNALRGAGLDGLAGPRAARPIDEAEPVVRLVRPLLDVPAPQLRAWLDERGAEWREDASNHSGAYRRNRMRSSVLPALDAAAGGDAAGALARAASHLRSYRDADADALLTALWAGAADARARVLRADVLAPLPPGWRGRVILEALRRWWPSAPRDAAFVSRIEALVGADAGRRVEAAGGAVWRTRAGLAFVPDAGPPAGGYGVLEPGARVATPVGVLGMDSAPRPRDPGAGRDACWVELSRVGERLAVRPWRAGERMRPLGFDRTRLLSDVLTDARVAPHLRAGYPVVVSGDVVVWVPGIRAGEAARLPEDADGRYAKISLLPGESA